MEYKNYAIKETPSAGIIIQDGIIQIGSSFFF